MSGPRGAQRPAHDDGAVDADAGRDVDHDTRGPGRAGQLGQLLVGGQERRSLEERPREGLVGRHELGQGQQAYAVGGGQRVERARR